MKMGLEKFVFFLYNKYGITPKMLSYMRIFAAPWLALLISKTISDKNSTLIIVTLALYILITATDFLDGILARAISSIKGAHDHSQGGMLDRLSDKILIIFTLIPFGLNLFTFLIIGGESILAHNALVSPPRKKQATNTGKLKMLFQTLLIPVLILYKTTNFIPDFFLFIFIILTVILTYTSIYSHFLKND